MRKGQIVSLLALAALIILLSSLPLSLANVSPHHSSANDIGSGDGNLGVVDALSLSFVGNLHFPQAIDSLAKIADGIAHFISMDMVEALVDVLLNHVPGLESYLRRQNEVGPMVVDDGQILSSRVDVSVIDQRSVLKDELVTVFGAVLGKQECWEKSACFLGWRTRWFAAKELVLLMAEKVLPETWESTLDLVREGMEGERAFERCVQFNCSTSRQQQIIEIEER